MGERGRGVKGKGGTGEEGGRMGRKAMRNKWNKLKGSGRSWRAGMGQNGQPCYQAGATMVSAGDGQEESVHTSFLDLLWSFPLPLPVSLAPAFPLPLPFPFSSGLPLPSPLGR